MTLWRDPPHTPIPASLDDLNLHPLIARVLHRRGLTDPDSIRAFLHPEQQPSIPYPNIGNGSIGGISTALDRLESAFRRNETVCVWGDFDVDGQTSTALLVQTLRARGMKVVHYIPIRGRESHGLHIQSLAPILDGGASLVLTCDTGITAHEAVGYARSRGVDVIITDHHELGERFPDAKAIISPKLLPSNHPLSNLSGVGVAFKLAEVIQKSESELEGLLDLVALGLIADVASLQGETRSLVRKGIQILRQGRRLGLKVVAELAGANIESLTEETVGFTFAPRLNALGRLGDANPAVDLLLTQDNARARVLAAQIEGLNAQRRLLTNQVYEAAEARLRAEPELLQDPAILMSHPGWPGGVVGIVANKLVERHHKPAILLTESGDGILHGSARSVEGLNITQAIAEQKDILLGYGGHPMAAGLSLSAEKLPEFRRGLIKAIVAQLGQIALAEPVLQIDAWIELDDINQELADAIEDLAPFGAGNSAITLASHKVALKAAREIGKNREHLRLNIEDEKGYEQTLLWWGGAGETLPEAGSKFDIAWTLRAGTYRGQKQLTLNFIDFRVTEEPPKELKSRKLEVIDCRLQGNLDQIDKEALIWAEGEDQPRGTPRHKLFPSDTFVIYTAPPSPLVMRQAMEIVKPKIVYVFAHSPAMETPGGFLNRLAGLCNYAIHQRAGKTSLPELSAAMAALSQAVEIGLQWLAAGGQLETTSDEEHLILTSASNETNTYSQEECLLALRSILEETAAYRKYLKLAEDLKSLF